MPKIVNVVGEVAQVAGTLIAIGTGIISATEINGIAITNTPTIGEVLVATSSTTAQWTNLIDCNN